MIIVSDRQGRRPPTRSSTTGACGDSTCWSKPSMIPLYQYHVILVGHNSHNVDTVVDAHYCAAVDDNIDKTKRSWRMTQNKLILFPASPLFSWGRNAQSFVCRSSPCAELPVPSAAPLKPGRRVWEAARKSPPGCGKCHRPTPRCWTR